MTRDRGKEQRDALALLRADHMAILAALDELCTARWRARSAARKLAATCKALRRHTQIEAELFYPALRSKFGIDDVLDAARIEHRMMDELVGELLNGRSRNGLRAARIEALAMYAAHHFQDEEENLFPQVRATGIDLIALGQRVLARKRALEDVDYAVCRESASV